MFLSVSWAPDGRERFGNTSGKGLPKISRVSCDAGVERFHRAGYIAYVSGSTPCLTLISFFHLERNKIRVPILQMRNEHYKRAKSLLKDIELIMVCRSLSEPMLLTVASAALIVPNDTTLE